MQMRAVGRALLLPLLAALSASAESLRFDVAREIRPADVRAGDPLRAVSLAAADFDGDGFVDLAIGSSRPAGGSVEIHLADPEAFSPSRPETLDGIRNGRFPEPFHPRTILLPLQEAPEFLGAADFDGDAHADLVSAAREGDSLFLSTGDGRGGFSEPTRIPLPGGVTAFAVGRFDEPDGAVRIAVATERSGESALVVVGFPDGAGEPRGAIRLPGRATGISIGRFDDDRLGDLALVVGGRLLLRHGRDAAVRAIPEDDPRSGQLEAVSLPFSITAVAGGDYLPDRAFGGELAVADADGVVRILARGEPDLRPWPPEEILERRLRRIPIPSAEGAPWRVAADVGRIEPGGRAPILLPVRLSGAAGDDLVVSDPAAGRIRVLHEDRAASRPIFTGGIRPRVAIEVDPEGEPIAVLPVRLNVMGEPGLVVLRAGKGAPAAIPFLPLATFTVTKTTDSNDGACNADCSLREAVVASNANGTGADLVTFPPTGTFVLSIPSAGGTENAAATGDLDINGSLTITGAGAANTILSTNYTSACGDCKVFGINQTGAFNGLTVSMSGLTIQNGWNNGAGFCGTFYETGGGIDFFLTGTGNSHSLTNCVIRSNKAAGCTLSHGGGVNVDSLNALTVGGPSAGTVTFNGCTFTLNSSDREGGGLSLAADKHDVNLGSTGAWTGNQTLVSPGYGGGIALQHLYGGTVTMTGGTVQNNTSAGAGGGIYVDGNPNIGLSNVTISGNTSASSGTGSSVGGGIAFGSPGVAGLSHSLSVSDCTITGNHADNGAAAQGGGVWFHSFYPVTFTSCTIGSNTSRSGAGAYNDGSGASPAAALTFGTGTTIQGNTASGNGGGVANGSGSAVTAFSGATLGGAAALRNSAVNGGGISVSAGALTLAAGNVTFGANTATGSGGQIHVAGGTLSVSGLTLSGGSAANGAGAAVSGGTLTLTKNTITGNVATTAGGALSQTGGTLVASYNRIVGNTAAGARSGLSRTAGTGAVDGDWWGCSTSPTALPCDVVSGAVPASWLQLRHTGSPNPVCPSGASTLTASFLVDSAGSAVSTSNLTTLIGQPVTFGNPVLGTLSGAQPSITAAGTATVTWTSNGASGTGQADAAVDNGATTANVTVDQPAGVSSDPTDQTACSGTAATFTAGAAGSPAPSVQWQRSTDGGGSWANVSGAISNPYSFTATGADDGNRYRVVLTNACGSATSAGAKLTVTNVPATPVGNTALLSKSGGSLKLTWTDVAGAVDYVAFEDPSGSGVFAGVTGSAATGSTGLTFAVPASDRYFLVAPRNACGTGAKK